MLFHRRMSAIAIVACALVSARAVECAAPPWAEWVQLEKWDDILAQMERSAKGKDPAYREEGWFLLHALALEKKGRPLESVRVLEPFAGGEGLFQTEVWEEVSRLALALGDSAKSDSYLAMLAAGGDERAADQARFQMALNDESAGGWAGAEEKFADYAMRRGKRRLEVPLHLARILIAKKQWGQAAQTLLRVVSGESSTRQRVEAAAEASKTPEIMGQIRASEGSLAEVAHVLLNSRELGSALKLYDDLLRIYPASASANRYRFLRGRALFLRGDFDRAREVFRQGLSWPGNIAEQCLRNLARTGLLSGDLPEALDSYKRLAGFARAMGDRYDAMVYAFNILLAQKRKGDAMKLATDARGGMEGEWRMRLDYRLAVVRLLEGGAGQATSQLEEIRSRWQGGRRSAKPSGAEFDYYVGLGHQMSGREDDAVRSWARSIYTPEDVFSHMAMDSLDRLLPRGSPGRKAWADRFLREFESASGGRGKKEAYEALCKSFFFSEDAKTWGRSLKKLPSYEAMFNRLARMRAFDAGAAAVVKGAPASVLKAVFLHRLGLWASAAAAYESARAEDLAQCFGVRPGDADAMRDFTAARLYFKAGLFYNVFRAGSALVGGYPEMTPFQLMSRDLMDLAYPEAYGATVRAECAKNGLDPAIAFAVMRHESHFNRWAHSTVSARGLMQIMPDTAVEIAKGRKMAYSGHPDDLYDPATNIAMGVAYLKDAMARFLHPAPVVAAYNGGPTMAGLWKDACPGSLELGYVPTIQFAQTRGYAVLVLSAMRVYQLLRAPAR